MENEKMYLNINVYEALQQRLEYIFNEFDNVLVSFSGGKDSGLLTNLVIDYARRHNYGKKIGLFHQDFEAQYSYTGEYVERMFERYLPYIEPYWACLPMATRTSFSAFESFWYPWDDEKQDLWVRPMPEKPYVINLSNPFELYRYKMHQEDLAKQFCRWYGMQHEGKTITLLGLRADESLHRYNAIINKRHDYNGHKWITADFKNVWSAAPLYDWTAEDVWIANAKFGYDYNHLYDLYYKAGLSVKQMRVASPFNDYAKESINLYRVIEPETWTKLLGRVQGVNFAAIYGKTKAMGYKEITCPPGHTWKSYTQFLLSTLPEQLRSQYLEKFKTSAEFWAKTGGGFAENVIAEIESLGYPIERNGVSNYSKDGKSRIIWKGEIPDNTDNVTSTIDIPSWKRMCYCILKNDHMCKFMGFGLTREQQSRVKAIKEKYRLIAGGRTDV